MSNYAVLVRIEVSHKKTVVFLRGFLQAYCDSMTPLY
jgi:hypothetical protein